MDYLHGPSITTRVLIRGRQEGQSERVGEGAVTMEAEVSQSDAIARKSMPRKNGGSLWKLVKRGIDDPLKPPEGTALLVPDF